ncbi:MAG: 3-deoxy-D-manno-octulosonate 8-phosphate phosphatase [Alphaproteobacteria bacterium]|nr:3-deoxy-D-manno-octulosonate 8-phosphate phosphatase [Alphaproteobacteria bacterium]
MTSALRLNPQLLMRAQDVRMVFLDVDGVLTDGGLYFTEQGETLKRFNSLDGQGIKYLMSVGIVPAIITGRDSAPLRQRLKALGVSEAHFGVHDKLAVAQQILKKTGLGFAQAAAMGDDWPDLPLLIQCALAAAPAQAHVEVLAQAHWISARQGGHGAVRELCDLILLAQGHYVRILREVTAHGVDR